MKETTIAELHSAARDYVLGGFGCAQLDARLGQVFPCTSDGVGFISPIAYVGNEQHIVGVARVSTDSKRRMRPNPDGHLEDGDKGLFQRLMARRHTSPFHMASAQVLWVAPLPVLGHVVRHRTASLSVNSFRYDGSANFYYRPAPGDLPGWGGMETVKVDDAMGQVFDLYESLIVSGVPSEHARMVLPQSVYTRWVWSIDLKNLMDFLVLRCAPDAQEQTRDYARSILANVLYPWSPLSGRYVEATLLHRHGLTGLGDGKYEPVGCADTETLLRAVQFYHRTFPELPAIGGGHG